MSSKDGQARRLLFSGRLRPRQARWVLELACPASCNGVLLAVGKQKAGREAGTGQAATQHWPKLGAVKWQVAGNSRARTRRPHGISVPKCYPAVRTHVFLTKGHTECKTTLKCLTSRHVFALAKRTVLLC